MQRCNNTAGSLQPTQDISTDHPSSESLSMGVHAVILQHLARLVKALPFGLVVCYIDDALRIEDVALDVKYLPELIGRKSQQGREHEHHVPTFVEDGASAGIAARLARQLVLCLLERRVVESQTLHPILKAEMRLFENGSPLHRGPVDSLAVATVAVFAAKRLLLVQPVDHPTAVALSLDLLLEAWPLLWGEIGCSSSRRVLSSA